MAREPAGFCTVENFGDDSASLYDVVFDAAADPFQQQWNIQEIIWRCDFHFQLQAADVHGKCEQTFTRKAGKEQHPRGGEVKWRVVKYAFDIGVTGHQLIEAQHDTAEHEIHIARGEDYALGFAGSA